MDFFQIIIYATVFLYILMGAGLLLIPWRLRNILLAGIMFLIGYSHLTVHLIWHHTVSAIPDLYYIHIPVFFLLGPMVFFYTRNIIEENHYIARREFIHFILPGAALIIIILIIAVLPEQQKHDIIEDAVSGKGYHFVNYLLLAAIFIFVCYIAYSMFLVFKNAKKENPVHRKLAYFILLQLAIDIIIGLSIILAISIEHLHLMRFTCVLMSLLVVIQYLLNQRYPHLIQHATIGRGGASGKKSKSYLGNVDKDGIASRLKLIMEEERFFCDEDLTLPRLAGALEITPHQLSEFLNTQYGKNFNSYINSYRVEESKKIMLEYPRRNALSIAYAAGFNSYSAFHSAFKKETSMSPAEFRKKNINQL